MPSIGTVSGDIEVRDSFSATFERARSQLNQTANKWNQAGKKMQSVGRTMTLSITAPILGIGTASFKAAASFEQGMLKIENLVGVTGEVLAEMGRNALEISRVTAQAPEKIVDALFFITSAGIRDVARASAALELAAKGAAIGLGSAKDVADMATSAMNAYAKSGMTAKEATNTLALAVREGKLVSEDLAGVMGRLMPLASSMGIRLNDVAGVLAVYSRTGLAAAEAATSLRAFMVAILKPAKDVRDRLAAIGLSQQILAEEAMKDNGIINVMRMVEKAVKKEGMTMAQIFPNVRALSGVMNALAQSGASVDEIMRSVGSNVDVVGEGFGRFEKTMAFVWQSFRNEIDLAFIAAGDAFGPFIADLLVFTREIVGGLAELARWFEALPGPVKRWTAELILLAAMLGPMAIGLGAVARGISGIALAMTSGVAVKTYTLGIRGAQGAMNLFGSAVTASATTYGPARDALGKFTGGTTKLTGSLLGKAGLIGAVGALGYALGSVLNYQLERSGLRLDSWLDAIGWYTTGTEEAEQAALDLANASIIQTRAFESLAAAVEPTASIIGLLRIEQKKLKEEAIELRAVVAAEDALLERLGFTTQKAADIMVDELVEAWKTGRITTKQLQDAASKLGGELKDLDLLTKEHTNTLNLLSNGQLAYEKLLENMTPLLGDVHMGLGEIETDYEALVPTLKAAKAAHARQVAVMEELNGVTGKTTVEWGKFATSIRTGNKDVDQWLGKAKGLFNMFGKLIKLLGDGTEGVAGFFSSIGNAFKSLFGGGKGGSGGVVKSAVDGVVSTMAAGGAAASTVFINGAALSLPGLAKVGVEGATGFLGGMSGILTSMSSFLPIIGPMLAMFGGPMIKGLKSLFGKLFGAVSEMEKAGRVSAADFTATLGELLGTAQKAEIAIAVAGGATKAWATKVIALRDAFMTLGKSEAEALAISDALWKAEREGPEAVLAVIEGIQPSLDEVAHAMEVTGLSLTDLRDLVINTAIDMGGTVSEAFAEIVAEAAANAEYSADVAVKTITVMEDKVTAVQDNLTAQYEAMYDKITDDASLSTIERTTMLETLSIQHENAMKDMTAQAAKAADAMEDGTIKAVDNMVDALDNAFNDLSYDINFNGKDDGQGRTSNQKLGFASGGFGDFGAGTDVTLHGPEFIVPASKAGEFAAKHGGAGDGALLNEIRQLSAALRRSADMRSVQERDRSLMGR